MRGTTEDIDAIYPSSCLERALAQLIGKVLGSQSLGERAIASLTTPNEQMSARTLQTLLLEAIHEGTLNVKGIGPKRLSKLQAAVDLGRTLYLNNPERGTVVDDPTLAAEAFNAIAWEPVEKFAVLALDTKQRIVSFKVIFSGTATESLAHPREIFRWVISRGATRCIIAHNHPSGSLEPSKEDRELTKQLIESGTLLGVPVLDHLIVSRGHFLSIRQETNLWH